jgi:DNA modification methylase
MKLLQGNSLDVLKTLDAESVQCVVTSPPYYGLRDYGMDGQIGNEETPEAYVERLVAVFREARRVLRSDGTLWLNLGDSYAGSGRGENPNGKQGTNKGTLFVPSNHGDVPSGLKPKDLIGIPWMVAFALRADGWYLRQEIIWNKPNPMPESVKDRCTKAHEQIFLLAKSRQYYFNQDAIREPAKDASLARLNQDVESQQGSKRANGGMKTNGNMKAVKKEWQPTQGGGGSGFKGHSGNRLADGTVLVTANKKTVWTVTTKPYKEAHFATFPPDLIEPCILAGSRPSDIVLDPFNGSGTSGEVALRHRRDYIGIELNPNYIRLTERRLLKVQPVLLGG